jgi:hypothetical protein
MKSLAASWKVEITESRDAASEEEEGRATSPNASARDSRCLAEPQAHREGQKLTPARGRTHHYADLHRTVSSIPNRTDINSRTWARPVPSFSTTVSL